MDEEFLKEVENAYQGYLEYKHDENDLGNWIYIIWRDLGYRWSEVEEYFLSKGVDLKPLLAKEICLRPVKCRNGFTGEEIDDDEK